MSASSPETSLSSSSSRDDEECWEDNPTTPSSISRMNSLDCWDYTIELECLTGTEDLQLAAELGKTLLERNKELECNLKNYQLKLDEQLQEIEFLNKQNAALHEVNHSRLKVYDNLEVSIHDLEKGNHRLAAENADIRKKNKSLKSNAENAEARCDELSKQIEELQQQIVAERRKSERILQEKTKKNELQKVELKSINYAGQQFDSDITSTNNSTCNAICTNNASVNMSYALRASEGIDSVDNGILSLSLNGDTSRTTLDYSEQNEKHEELFQIMTELEATKRQYISEQHRVTDLEEQINALLQENNSLRLRAAEAVNENEMRSMQDELSGLDEVRFGKMCNRCMGNIDDDYALPEEDISIAGTDDGDEQTIMETQSNMDVPASECLSSAYQSGGTSTIKIATKPSDLLLEHDMAPSPNPYRDLVEKYEALLEVKRQPILRSYPTTTTGNSLMDEMATSNDFTSTNNPKESDDNYHIQKHHETGTIRKRCTRTPTTDFSEAETSSSGFSDETSNKFTQTDETFLCTIADGEDKFSIYDDAIPIDSRFRNRPEYRELFKEIFAILKKAAENKDDGEKLPLLDDTNNPCFKVPPVTPAVEDLPTFPTEPSIIATDDTESVVSSIVSEQSIAMSECITKKERKHIMDTVKKHIERTVEQQQNENKPPTTAASTTVLGSHVLPDGRVMTPLKREQIDYLAVSVNIRKKKRRGKNVPVDRSDSPILPTPPRVFYTSSGKKRRDMRPTTSQHVIGGGNNNNNTKTVAGHSTLSPGSGLWNGSSMTIYNRSIDGGRIPPSPLSINRTIKPATAVNVAGSSAVVTATVDNKPVVTKEFRRVSAASQNLQQLIKFELSYAEVLRRADSRFQLQRKK